MSATAKQQRIIADAQTALQKVTAALSHNDSVDAVDWLVTLTIATANLQATLMTKIRNR